MIIPTTKAFPKTLPTQIITSTVTCVKISASLLGKKVVGGDVAFSVHSCVELMLVDMHSIFLRLDSRQVNARKEHN